MVTISKRKRLIRLSNASRGLLACVLAVSFLALTAPVAAVTTTLNPTAVGNFDQWALGAGTDKVVAVTTDDGDASYIRTSTYGYRQTFAFPGAVVPDGSIINSVTLNVVARKIVAEAVNIRLIVTRGAPAGDASGVTIPLSTTYTTYTRTMTTNPFTVAPWTVSEVNNWQTADGSPIYFGVRHYQSQARQARVTQIYVVVDYTPPPVVDSIEIFEDPGCNTVASSLTPQTTYYAKATVTSSDNLSYLDTVQVTIFYDSAGSDPIAPTTPDTQTCAILTCTVGPPPTWNIDAGSPTTWQIVPGSCSQPANLDVTTGDWIFAFTPGKVATESIPPSDWDAQGLAINESSQSGELYVRDKAMNWYGEIDVTTPLVDWGPVDLGLQFADADNPETGIAINYIANGDYEEDIRSTDWTGAVSGDTVALDETGGDPPTNPSEFALMGNDINALGSAVIVQTTYNDIDDTGTITSEDGDDVNTNTLWLSLSASGIVPDTYSGGIYYQIANR